MHCYLLKSNYFGPAYLIMIKKMLVADKVIVPNTFFVYLEFFVPLENFFHSFGDVTIAVEVLQILTFARHLWPLS